MNLILFRPGYRPTATLEKWRIRAALETRCFRIAGNLPQLSAAEPSFCPASPGNWSDEMPTGVMIMKFGKALFARFGLFAPKQACPDLFDLRLQRIGRRERLHDVRRGLFRNPPSPLAI